MTWNWTWLGMSAAVLLLFSSFMGFRRGFVKEVVSTLFVVLSIVLVWMINPYVNTFIRENTPVYGIIQDGCRSLVDSRLGGENSVGQAEQKSLIDDLDLPEFLKNGLSENNTADVYQFLSAGSFGDYVSGYLATAVTNGVSFLISYLTVTVLIHILTYMLDIIARLPVIHGANKIAGALVGAVKGVIFLWIAFLVLTVLCNTEIGRTGLGLIEQDSFLRFLYDRDIFVKVFMNIFYGS